MTQNLIGRRFTERDLLDNVDGALLTLEHFALNSLVGLTPEDRKRLTKMGDKSEAFCRLTADVVKNSIDVMPHNFDMEAYLSDLEQLDLLRPRLVRLSKIFQLVSDTDMALGSDLMVNSLEAYAFLKVAGKSTGLNDLRRQMSARFQRGPRRAEPRSSDQ